MAIMRGYLPADRWERVVHEEMRKQLPNDWLVVANVAWSRRRNNPDMPASGYVRDGQADFVVLAPGLGMLVVEVKGSHGFQVREDGTWFRLSRRKDGSLAEEMLEKSPMDQARGNQHEIADLCCKKLAWAKFQGIFGCVVIYPQGEVVKGQNFLEDSTMVLTAKDLPSLEHRFRAALQARGPEATGALFTVTVRDKVAEVLTNGKLEIGKVDTAHEAGSDAAQIHVLTSNQFSALQGIFWNKRVGVTGPAGSGKTLLAAWRAKAFKGEGKRVLFTCFNKLLAAYLHEQHPDLEPDIVHADKLFMDLARKVGPVTVPVEGRDTFFRTTLPQLAMDYASFLPDSEKFDAIVVDEGQDFSFEQQMALLELLPQERPANYAFFWDAGQDLYKRATSLPLGTSAIYVLEHNCRNTVRICERASKVGQRSVAPMPGLPEGTEPVVEVLGGGAEMASRTWAILDAWRKTLPGRLAVLSPYQLENSCLASSRKSGALQLVTEPEAWSKPGAVFFSTIKAFKGLEAEGVVVVDLDVPGAHPAITVDDLYVACTRPTVRLSLLTTKAAAKAYLLTGER